jgi:hypothetical protein
LAPLPGGATIEGRRDPSLSPESPLMRCVVVGPLVALLALVVAIPVQSAEPEGRKVDALAEQVRAAIEGGIKYLRAQEAGRGNLEKGVGAANVVPGGLTALGTFALLTAGVPPEDPTIQRLLTTIRRQPLEQTYVVALQTMAYAAAGQNEDKDNIQQCVTWLVNARHHNGKQLAGWTYGAGGAGGDNSNTQYALLGLHEGQLAGARIAPEVWEEIREYYTRQSGGSYLNWGYHTHDPPTPTMAASGLCGMLIAGMDLNAGRETLLPDGTARNCGVYEEDRHLAAALELVGRQMPNSARRVAIMGRTYYWLYCIERAGRLSGQRFLGGNDWYRIGCEFLVDQQSKDEGYFQGEGHPLIATSFALLFLAKGRTPVLISKLVHGLPNQDDTDWNNDRNDARNLVDFVSKEVFQKKRLAWQVFNPRGSGDLSPQRVEELTSDLLQSPIAYFNGHRAPFFTDGEKQLLRKYVENGGFLLAEACCGQPAFDRGFRQLMVDLFPRTPLRRLPPGHPIWTASGKFQSDPDKYELWGINLGCKTVVVYSPRDLSCRWESNRLDDGHIRGAFELGANIVAYATGLEAPKPRLTKMQVFDERDKTFQRGYLKVGQVWHEGDWRPAPQAMPNLMQEMRKLGMDVSLQAEEVRLGERASVTFKFLYMHGRNPFAFPKEELKRLRFNLETGGLLLADACCGSKSYDKAFRDTVKEVWPDKALEPIPLTDELFGQELNDTAIKAVRCRREGTDGRPETNYRTVPPQLEGIKINGRWVVIYSKYDIGCALENHQAVDCLGHDHDSAVQLAKAAVLYALRR